MTIRVIPWDGKPISAPGVYSGVDSASYHSGKLCAGPSISSTGLRTIFTKSPLEYWVNSPLNPNRLPQEDSRAFIVGRALHLLCLEGKFKEEFVCRPEEYEDEKGSLKKWTRASAYCKKWEAEAEELGLAVITPAELEMLRGMAGLLPWQEGLEDSGLMNNAVVRAGALEGLVEHTVAARDAETGVWLLARPDVIPTASREIGDLKSTQSVEQRELQRTLETLRYDMQFSLASMCLEQAAGFRLENFALIFVTKTAPHEVAVRELKHFDMEASALDLQAAIRTFAICMERGRWPGVGGGEEDAKYLERSQYSRDRAIDRRNQLSRLIFG